MQGRVAAFDLAGAGHSITILDINKNNFKPLPRISAIKPICFDVTDKKRLVAFIKEFDIILGALPASLGFYSIESAINAGCDIVDMSYMPEDPLLLHKQAKKKKVRVIPDAGFAPGLSNILVGQAYQTLKKIDSIRILAGGIPQKPEPPFNYHITWSPQDLIEEYLRPARIVKDFKVRTVPALKGIEKLTVPKIGKLECFYTDGLRTLINTFKEVKDMEEKTIRYQGHAQLFKTLIDCGFMSENPVTCAHQRFIPKQFTVQLLRNQLSRGDKRDISILIVMIRRGNKKIKYTCIDHYDRQKKISSMARMTAFTGSLITQCIKNYSNYGVIPPEFLGANTEIFSFINSQLKRRNIVIKGL